MKKIILLIANIIFSGIIFSQSPQKMSYQAVVRNINNELVKSIQVGIQISIVPDSPDSVAIYVEIQTPTTNNNGLMSVQVGEGTKVTGTFSAINWSYGIYYIKTEIDPSGGNNYTLTAVSQLLSVPYALYSEKSGNASLLQQQVKVIEDLMIDAGTYKLKDIDGNQYKVVKLGNQVWMAENLRTTHLNDGTSVPVIWYNNDSIYKSIYGGIYNIRGGKICPAGWHVPTYDTHQGPNYGDWQKLKDYLQSHDYGYGEDSTAIGKSMASTAGWVSDTIPGNVGWEQETNNLTGLNMHPGGIYTFGRKRFLGLGELSGWWSSSRWFGSGDGTFVVLGYNGKTIGGGHDTDGIRCYIRCIRDY